MTQTPLPFINGMVMHGHALCSCSFNFFLVLFFFFLLFINVLIFSMYPELRSAWFSLVGSDSFGAACATRVSESEWSGLAITAYSWISFSSARLCSVSHTVCLDSTSEAKQSLLLTSSSGVWGVKTSRRNFFWQSHINLYFQLQACVEMWVNIAGAMY